MKIDLKPVIDFGQMPIANAFLTEDEFGNEFFYNMVLGYNSLTQAIGLVNTVPREKMFHNNYAFFSSTSKSMQTHFKETAEKLKKFVGGGIVVEMGSNDGIMLDAWKELGVRAIGVEPSANVAKISKQRGHEVIVDFLNEEVVNDILARATPSLVFGANVSCHVEDIHEYLTLITRLIGKKGVFVFEDPYFLDMVEKTSYDQIYDEHLWYFTVSFINNILAPIGYHVFDCEHVSVHGGELRMYVGHQDTHTQQASVREWLAKETDLPNMLDIFKKNVEASRTTMKEILTTLVRDGKRVCGFGASSKGVIVCNYCGIDTNLIPFITDNTPFKQGKYYPGVHIPIKPQEEFKDVDVAVLFAWNHIKEIDTLPIVKPFRLAKGKWLTHVPTPHLT